MSQNETVSVLANMKEIELEKAFEACCDGDTSIPLTSLCEEVIRNYNTLEKYYDNKLLLKFVQTTANILKNKTVYADLENKSQLYIYMQTVYSGFFMFASLVIDFNRNIENSVENIDYIFRSFTISLEKLIAINYYPRIQNIYFLKLAIFYLLKYNFQNNDLIVGMTTYAFSDYFTPHVVKNEWIKILREYVVMLPEKLEAKYLLQKLCTCFRKLNQNYYGALLIKSSSNKP